MNRVAPAPIPGEGAFDGTGAGAVQEEKNDGDVAVIIEEKNDLDEPAHDEAHAAMLPANGVPATLTIENHRLLPSNPETGVEVEDATYIPREAGEGFVKSVAVELAQTKLRHKQVVAKLDAAHRELLSATRKHYETYIEELRSKAKKTRARYKDLLKAAHNDIAVQKQEIDTLQDDKGTLILQKARLVAGGAAMHHADENRLQEEKQSLLAHAEKQAQLLVLGTMETLDKTMKILVGRVEDKERRLDQAVEKLEVARARVGQKVLAAEQAAQRAAVAAAESRGVTVASATAGAVSTPPSASTDVAVETGDSPRAVNAKAEYFETKEALERTNEEFIFVTEQLIEAKQAKADAKRAIKKWEHDFKERENRNPADEDRANDDAFAAVFQYYKASNSKLARVAQDESRLRKNRETYKRRLAELRTTIDPENVIETEFRKSKEELLTTARKLHQANEKIKRLEQAFGDKDKATELVQEGAGREYEEGEGAAESLPASSQIDSKMKELEEVLEASKLTINERKERTQELEKTVFNLQQENTLYKKRLESMEIADKDERTQALEKTLAEMQEEVSTVNQEKEEARAEAFQLKDKVSLLLKAGAEQVDTIASLELRIKAFEELKLEKERGEAKIAELENALARAVEMKAQEQGDSGASESKLDAQSPATNVEATPGKAAWGTPSSNSREQDKQVLLGQDADAAAATRRRLETELTSLQSENERLQRLVAAGDTTSEKTTAAAMERSEAQRKAQEAKVAELSAQLRDATEVTRALEKRSAVLEDSVGNLESENETYRKRIESMEMQDGDEREKALGKALSDVQDQLAKANKETSSAKAEANELRAQLADLLGETKVLRAKVFDLQDELDGTRSSSKLSIEQKEKEVVQLQQEIEKLKAVATSSAQGGIALAVAKGAGDVAALSAAMTEIKMLKTTIAKLEQSAAVAAVVASAGVEGAATSTATATVTENSIAALKEASVQLQEENGRLREEVEELKRSAAAAAAAGVGSVSAEGTTTIGKSDPLEGIDVHKLSKHVKKVIEQGRDLWVAGKKQACYELYLGEGQKLVLSLPDGHSIKEELAKSISEAEGRNNGVRGAAVLRKALEVSYKALKSAYKARMRQASAASIHDGGRGSASGAAVVAPSVGGASSGQASDTSNLKRAEAAEAKLKAAQNAATIAEKRAADDAKTAAAKLSALTKELKQTKGEIKSLNDKLKAAEKAKKAGPSAEDRRAAKETAQKIKKLEKELQTSARKHEKELSKKEDELRKALANASDPKELKAAQRALEDAQKKAAKSMADMSTKHAKEVASLTKALEKSEATIEQLREKLTAAEAKAAELETKVKQMGAMGSEIEELREAVASGEAAKAELDSAKARAHELEALYKEERMLRKRYFNMMEDMKGKIRVYCRVRPLNSREINEHHSKVCVSFPDECTIDVKGEKGTKQFVYDQCFPPTSTQDEIFEDCSNLIQSAFDGYNVCVFAYGQTGSGKTYTMVGPEDSPGLTRKAITRIFDMIEDSKKTQEVTVSVYMAELYNDMLVDLLFKVEHGHREQPPSLAIKHDAKGMVVIKGIVMKEVTTAEECMEQFMKGNGMRHIGSTKMNAESSRSHLVFSVLITNTSKEDGKVSTGKLSLVDLAGSERVGKTGATKERLREAMSINKSLSALGDVISALSKGDKFIPYRNNKLTQLLSDGLGGNAKTLMFVNCSPADYNSEETTNSLVYASRVKLITNDAKKENDSAETAELKKIIKELVASGGTSATRDAKLKAI